jgi:hypothetical protein
MFFKAENLTGTALQSATIALAKFCIEVEKEYGQVNIDYVIKKINRDYGLTDFPEKLVHDVSLAFQYVKKQQLTAINAKGYRSWSNRDNRLNILLDEVLNCFKSPSIN